MGSQMSFRLPWVSRAELDAATSIIGHQAVALAAERRRRETSEHLCAEWREKFFTEYDRRLKVETANVGVKEPSPVARIIREQAQGPDGREDLGLARHLRTYASRLRREKKSEDEIVAALVAWQTTEQAE